MKKLQYLLLALLAGIIFFFSKETYRAQMSEKSLEKDVKLRQDSIRMYRDREAIQSKHIQFWQTAYNQAKDSLEIEKGKVKIKYIEYRQPIKIDLSTDSKRDSVIDQLVK